MQQNGENQEVRPPVPPFHRGHEPGRRSRRPRTPGTPATRRKSRWPTPRTPSGATATSSSRAARRSVAFLKRKWARELDYRLGEEPVVLHGKPHRGQVRVRVPRRCGALVEKSWE